MTKGSFEKWSDIIISECHDVIKEIDANSVEKYLEILLSKERVFFVGVGRVQLALMSIAKRYNHLGIDCAIVGEITEPALTPNDLLIVGSGSGNTLIPVAIARKAKELGATVVHIGSNSSGLVSEYVDHFVRIPTKRTSEDDGIRSQQPMTSLFEQSLLIFGDITAAMIIDRNDTNINDLWEFHANLE